MSSHHTQYQVDAALWVVRAVDVGGTDEPALEAAFRNAVTQGRFAGVDLDNAYALLLDRNILVVAGSRTFHHESLVELLPLSDATAALLLGTLLAAALDNDEDDVVRREVVGALGEEAAAARCVDELRALGHHTLAEQVRRVSLVSDRFGYDVSAPSIRAEPRMLEVKTSTSKSRNTFRFYLTRHEYEVGRRHLRDWAMVACTSDGASASVLGWCRATEFERYLPDDGNGRWLEALVSLPSSALLPGVPSALP